MGIISKKSCLKSCLRAKKARERNHLDRQISHHLQLPIRIKNKRFINIIARVESVEYNLGVIEVHDSANAENLKGIISSKFQTDFSVKFKK